MHTHILPVNAQEISGTLCKNFNVGSETQNQENRVRATFFCLLSYLENVIF